MISNETHHQLGTLKIDPTKPLLICDVDEVIVHFTRDFEHFIAAQNLSLQANSLALAGNIYLKGNPEPIAAEQVVELIDTFFVERTRNMKPIMGAIDAIKTISKTANIVFLTNLPHTAGDDRRANLVHMGLEYPVITNSGPKGPALHNLAARTKSPVVFVDDSPAFIKSANEHAPHIHLVHFLQDERFAPHAPAFDFVSLRTNNWTTAQAHILDLIS